MLDQHCWSKLTVTVTVTVVKGFQGYRTLYHCSQLKGGHQLLTVTASSSSGPNIFEIGPNFEQKRNQKGTLTAYKGDPKFGHQLTSAME